MKKLLIIVTGIFMIACNNKTETKATFNDLTNDNLKGDIASIEESPYQTDSAGKIGAMDSCCIDVTEYNADGNTVKDISKDSKGTLKGETAFARHENGLWKSATETKNGKTRLGFDTQLDKDGKYTGGQAYDSAGKLDVYYTNLTQNEYGQVMSWKQYDKDSVFRMQGEAKFDKNMQTGFTMKDSVGKVKSSSTSKYNDKGELTETSNTNVGKDSTTTKVTKYSYDAHDDMGNWTQRTEWNDKGKAVKITKRAYTYRKKEEKK